MCAHDFAPPCCIPLPSLLHLLARSSRTLAQKGAKLVMVSTSERTARADIQAHLSTDADHGPVEPCVLGFPCG